jgi:HlyD family secretion protein
MDLSRLQIDRGSGPRRATRRGHHIGRWVVVATLLGAGWLFRAPLEGLVERVRSTEVEVATVTRESPQSAAASSGIAASGHVVAQRRAALSADTPGRIVELNVTEGSVVRAGDVVARLYSDEAVASLRGAEAELAAGEAAAEAALARVSASEQRLAEAHARVTAAEAQREETASVLALAEREAARANKLVDTGGVARERAEQIEAAVAQARARLTSSESGVASARVGVDSATADIAVARADHVQVAARIPVLAASCDLARATLDKTVVRAPFDGVVVLKDAEVGEVVSPNALGAQSRGSVATMVDFGSLEVQVELPETSLSSVREEQPVEVFLDAFPAERMKGRVLRIWPTANRQKATLEVRIGLEQLDPRLRPEMGARVVFTAERAPSDAPSAAAGDDELESTPQLLVPATSVVRRGERDGVFALEGDVVRFRAVTMGRTFGRRVALVESPAGANVRAGDRVVVAPPPGLADGARVRVNGD